MCIRERSAHYPSLTTPLHPSLPLLIHHYPSSSLTTPLHPSLPLSIPHYPLHPPPSRSVSHYPSPSLSFPIRLHLSELHSSLLSLLSAFHLLQKRPSKASWFFSSWSFLYFPWLTNNAKPSKVVSWGKKTNNNNNKQWDTHWYRFRV